MSTPETIEPDIDGALDRTLGVDTSADRAPAEAPPEAPVAESGADDESITVSGQTYKNLDEFKKAHEELRTHLSSTRPVEPEPEPEYTNPWAAIPGIPSEQKDSLVAWAQEDPLAAGQWAWENREDPELPSKIANDLIAHAMQANPAGWEIYRHEQYAQMAQQAAEDRTSGFVQQGIADVAAAAESQIEAKLGVEEYAKYKARIEEKIASGDFVMPKKTWSGPVPPPHVLLDVNYRIYRDLWIDDHFDELQKPAAQPQNPRSAATQTKSQAGAGKDDVEGALDRALGLA